MKRAILILLATTLCGCSTVTELPAAEPSHYVLNGRYTDGTLTTYDGNVWEYTASEIVDKSKNSVEIYDNIPVFALMSDNGTSEQTDDIVVGLVFDRETAIYDDLDEEFSDYDIERNGNEIHIKAKEEK